MGPANDPTSSSCKCILLATTSLGTRFASAFQLRNDELETAVSKRAKVPNAEEAIAE
jgi:hypothetical protein